MIRRVSFCLPLLLLLAAARPVGAQTQADVRILSITATTVVANAAAQVNSLAARRLTKFTDATPAGVRALLRVDWRAPKTGLPGGTVVRLQYRRDEEETVRVLREAYPSTVQGDHSTTFTIPLTPNGRISSWRVQVLSAGRLVAERTSASWR